MRLVNSARCCHSSTSVVCRAACALVEALERRLCLSAATFGPAVSYPVGASANFVAVGDFNGDGRPDLVVANYDDNSVDVLLNKGNGTKAPFRSPWLTSTATAKPTWQCWDRPAST